MKIFGKEFVTKKELKAKVVELSATLARYEETFPLTLGHTVYDVQLRNDKGRYAKKNASLEHSMINPVVVDEKNYFGLVDRYRKNDVFLDEAIAKAYLIAICEQGE